MKQKEILELLEEFAEAGAYCEVCSGPYDLWHQEEVLRKQVLEDEW